MRSSAVLLWGAQPISGAEATFTDALRLLSQRDRPAAPVPHADIPAPAAAIGAGSDQRNRHGPVLRARRESEPRPRNRMRVVRRGAAPGWPWPPAPRHRGT